MIGRPDYEYGIARRLNYWRCLTCGYVFADPVPSTDVPSFYVSYTTHGQNAVPAGNFWRIAKAITPKADGHGAFPSIGVPRSARILDFGCGGGEFLTSLHQSGYRNLFAYDIDSKAAAFRLPHISFLSQDAMRRNLFDVIVMNHVLEHVEGPAETFQLLLSILDDGGFLYIRTPNCRSLLARFFGQKWRGWETPRHLQIFDTHSLTRLARRAGGHVAFIGTSNDMFTGIFVGSIGNVFRSRLLKKLAAGLMYIPASWAAHVAREITSETGEELITIVSKK